MRQSTQLLDLPFPSLRQAITPSELSSLRPQMWRRAIPFLLLKRLLTFFSPSSSFVLPSFFSSLWSRSKSEDRKVDSPDCAGLGLGAPRRCKWHNLSAGRTESPSRRGAISQSGQRREWGPTTDRLREIRDFPLDSEYRTLCVRFYRSLYFLLCLYVRGPS